MIQRFFLVFMTVMISQGFLFHETVTQNTLQPVTSEEELQKVVSSFEVVFRNNEIINEEIVCFSVNEDEEIALGFNLHSGEKRVSVYNLNGEFEYGYSFSDPGSFALDWDGDLLMIYSVRGESVLTLDNIGKCVRFEKIPGTPENRKYWSQILHSRKKTIGNVQYRIQNNMGILNLIMYNSCSQLVKIDQNGKEIVLYDASESYIKKTVLIFSLILIFIFVCLFFLTRLIIQSVKSIAQSVKSS